MSPDDYQLRATIAIIAIITINHDYCHNCEVIASLIAIIIGITLPLSGNYCDYPNYHVNCDYGDYHH